VNRFNSGNKDKKVFLENHYQTYKELCDYDVFAVIKTLAEMQEEHACIDIAKRLQTRCMPKIIRLDPKKSSDILAHLENFKEKNHIPDWQIAFITIPHQSYTFSEDPILIIDEREKIKPLNEMSRMIHAMGDQLEEMAFLAIDKSLFENKTLQKILFDV
jgi:hypothetical protein